MTASSGNPIDPDELRDEIADALNGLASTSPVLTSPTQSEKLYELFVWACVVRSLIAMGATLQPKDSNDSATNSLQFRLAPGLIYSPSSTPGFIHVTYRGEEYELQNGLRIRGSSGVLHELDICILDRNHAASCRNSSPQRSPSFQNVKLMIECKFYVAQLKLALGREAIGLSSEFTGRKIKSLVANIRSNEVHRLLVRHSVKDNMNLTPLDQTDLDEFQKWLARELKQILA